MTDEALVPVQQKAIDFYGDELIAVLVELDEAETQEERFQVLVPLSPICDYLGVDWSGQRQRILRDPVLADEMRTVRIEREGAGNPNVLCLPLGYLNGWLFGIDANRVRDELKPTVIRYQKECYRVLAGAFHGDLLTSRGEITPSTGPQFSELANIRDMALAIASLAEQQMELEAHMARQGEQLAEHDEQLEQLVQRLDKAAVIVGDIRDRLTSVERRVAPGNPVTEEQASEISLAVKRLANLLNERDPEGGNHYQGVFAELYRRFGVWGYKNIPATKYGEVMEFLREWRKSVLRGDE